ncbi:MAG: disulfide bond formation protein B [Emcibacter sp.]|nr:disulfide bond formation protein B [Emcibacter sp.]
MQKNTNLLVLLICYFWKNPLVLAFLMSASLIAGAYGFQYIGGMDPCDLCWTQRYAHFAILGLSGIGLLIKSTANIMGWATTLAIDVSIIAAGYHAGVEQKWWKGPDTCTSSGIDQNADMESLFDNMMEANLVLCDEIPWEMFGISMAGYNFLISLAVGTFVAFAMVSNFRKKHD